MKCEVKSVKVIKNFLSIESCKRLIEEHKRNHKEYTNIQGEKKYRYSNPKDDDFLKGIEILLKLELEKYIEENHINDFPNFKAGDFKLMEYQEGDWFVEHYDGDFSKWPEGGYKYHPMTTNIALNSWQDYRGGELHVCGKWLKMEAGDLVIFPSSYSFPHSVKMLSKGNRYVLVSEPYSLNWGLQDSEVIGGSGREKVNERRESLLSRSLRLFRKD